MITSADEFAKLRTSESPEEQRQAAYDTAPMHVWRDVIERYPDLREWVALNKTIPLEILAELADDPDVTVRSTVAQKRKLSLELMRKLAKDPHEAVRHSIAYNRSTPPDVLELLVNDPWPAVRERVLSRLRG